MKKIVGVLISTVMLVVFAGCGGSKPQIEVKQKPLPQWYTSPPQSNATTLYALGEGKDKQEAIANALNYMASTLSVSIESTYNAKTKVREGSVENSSDAQYTSDITSTVQKIRISNYRVLQQEKLGFKRYAVLVQSDKAQMFASLKQELDQQIELYKSQEKNLRSSEPIRLYKLYKDANAKLQLLPSTLVVMKELNSGFDTQRYLKIINYVQKQNTYYKSHINFLVRSNVNGLAAPVAKALGAQGFKIKNATGKMHYDVRVEATIQKAHSYGFTLARAELHIVTKNSAGVVVASNVIHLVGQSSQGYDIAVQDLVRRLDKKIETEGIGKVLNLLI